MSIKLGILASSQQIGGGTNPDATAFFNRVTAAGGSLTITEQNAINTLVNSLQSANIWNKFRCIYPMVGASSASCSINLISSSFTGIFVGGWTFSNNGAKPNGTNAYMQTNFSFRSNTPDYNNHFSMYSRTQDSSVNGFNLGCQETIGGSEIGLYQYYAAVLQKGGHIYEYPPTSPNVNNTNTLGYQIVSRTTISDARLYFNGSLLATNTTTSTIAQPNKSVVLAAMQRPSVIQEFTPHENAFTTFGDGLNGTEAASLYTSVQTFQTTLSRQV
jgi:hypothetical protein